MSSAFDKLIKKVADKNPMAVSCDGTIKWCPIESPQATYMMGGGVPTARIIRFRGPSSSGKSAFCNYLAGQLQKGCPELYDNPNKNKVLYLDFERTFEKRFATSVGVDTSPDKFFQLTFDTIEDMSDGIEDLVKSGEVAAIILDSDAAAPTRTTITDPAGKASFGSRAKALTEFCNKYNILCANYGTTVLWISQERANLNPMARLPTATGGEAINYYTSITCRITKTDDIKDATGDVCGIEMRVRNYKNKCSVPFRDANMKLYYDGGFDSNSEYIDFLLLLGIVKQAGAYFKFNHEGQDYSLQGRKKLQEWLDTHADVYDAWKKDIIEKISHHNEILDANNQATDENGNEISLDEAKKMGNAVDPAELASQALAAATGDDAVTD